MGNSDSKDAKLKETLVAGKNAAKESALLSEAVLEIESAVVKHIRRLETDSALLGELRATLIVNFGADNGRHCEKYGVYVNASDKTIIMLISAFEQFMAKCDSNKG